MDFETYFRFLLALVFVLALIGLIAWLARRFGVLRGAVRPRGTPRRLEVIETAPIDAKRRLVLVRRDRTEHLLLLGVNSELVIESNISVAAGPPRPARIEAEAAE